MHQLPLPTEKRGRSALGNEGGARGLGSGKKTRKSVRMEGDRGNICEVLFASPPCSRFESERAIIQSGR